MKPLTKQHPSYVPAKPPTVSFSADRKFTPEGHAIFVCGQYGIGPDRWPGLCGLHLHGKWEVEALDYLDRDEYGLLFAARESLSVEFTMLFTSKKDRDNALKIVSTDKEVKDMFVPGKMADVINNNSGKLALGVGAAAIAAGGFYLWNKKKQNEQKQQIRKATIQDEQEFDEANNYK